jgi:hypothetical protein
LGLLLSAGECSNDCFCRCHAPEIDCNERSRQSTVDEGAVDDDVYVVEAILEDGEAHGDRYSRKAQSDCVLKQTDQQRMGASGSARREGSEDHRAGDPEGHNRSGEGYPLYLLAHLASRSPVAQDQA